MTNYVWSVSSGGTITAGGTSTSNTVTVTWSTHGAQTVSVNFTNYSCSTTESAVYPVFVSNCVDQNHNWLWARSAEDQVMIGRLLLRWML